MTLPHNTGKNGRGSGPRRGTPRLIAQPGRRSLRRAGDKRRRLFQDVAFPVGPFDVGARAAEFVVGGPRLARPAEGGGTLGEDDRPPLRSRFSRRPSRRTASATENFNSATTGTAWGATCGVSRDHFAFDGGAPRRSESMPHFPRRSFTGRITPVESGSRVGHSGRGRRRDRSWRVGVGERLREKRFGRTVTGCRSPMKSHCNFLQPKRVHGKIRRS